MNNTLLRCTRNRQTKLAFNLRWISAAVMLAVASGAQATDFSFSGGTFIPNFTAPDPLAAGDVLNIDAGANKFFSVTPFTVQGTVNWNADSLFMQSGATIQNDNLWDAKSDNGLVYNGGAFPVFTNNGTFRKSAGLGDTTFSSIGLVNSGTFDAQTGAINFASSNATFKAGTVFTGAGVNKVTSNATFEGSFTSHNLDLVSGVFTASGAVVGGVVDFLGGVLTGDWTIAAGQTLRGVTGSNKFVSGGTVTNLGTVDWQTTDTLFMQSAGAIDNQALFVATESMAVAYNGGASPSFLNNTTGTLRAASGKTLTMGAVPFVNLGTLDADGIIDYAGGNATFKAGTVFTGAGVNKVTSNATFEGGYTSSNLLLAGGTFTGGDAHASGTTRFSGGTVTGTWQIESGQKLQIEAGANKFLSGSATVLTNKGVVEILKDPVFLQSGAKLVNDGLIDVQTDGGFFYNGGAGVSVTNNGTLLKSAGSGVFNLAGVGFTNPGTVNVASGAIQFDANFVNTGTLLGIGAFNATLLTNDGHIAPGDLATLGTLTINGNFDQTANGVFDIDLENLANFDLLVVNGTASLTGTLALHCLHNCAFAVGDEFTILDAAAGGLSGSLSIALLGFGTGAFETFFDVANGDVKLRILEAVTAPATVPLPPAGWLLGSALAAMLARRRSASTT